jgi:ribosomal protein S12 methylthiotransferase accessory factor
MLMPTMTVTFPGGKRVDAEYGGFTIKTDQSPKGGGEGSAPQPFDLFLASIATCAGIYMKGYCDARGIPADSLGLEMHIEHDHEQHRIGKLVLEIKLPEGFPEKHREAIIRAADLCSVKKHMLNPPAFEIRTGDAASLESQPPVEIPAPVR